MDHFRKRHLISLILIVFTFQYVQAEVKLPAIFSSHMVLQQGMDIPVWGWADPGEQVTVTLNQSTVSATAGSSGEWKVVLPPQKYGGPHTLTIRGKNLLILEDILVGEVWICSGQSNMQWSVQQSNNAEEEIAQSAYPEIRLFEVPRIVAQTPQKDISGGPWKVCSPETVARFSAVGYFFGKNIHSALDVPVGLIHSSWGGTVAETWISPHTISNDPDFRDKLTELQQLDMNAYREKKLQEIKKILGGEIPAEDKSIQNGIPVWSDPDLNDKAWKTIKTPMYWEQQGYIDIDGTGWYRKEVELTEQQTQASLTLHLGKIDDSDITFLNGFEIGKTENQRNQERVYTIDKKYLKPGKNMIVVRVDDTGGNGGIWGDPNDQFLAIGNERMDISGDWKFRISRAEIKQADIGPNSYPTLLFNAMIQPLIPFAIKGAIWYQGESNADRALQYQRVFPSLINDWRARWNQGEFPFLFVSLANFGKPAEQPGNSNWAELREAQTKTLALPKTGMALAIDIGEAGDIHPKNKQEVGRRLALNALKIAYNKDIFHSGPMFSTVQFREGKAFVTFTETGSGLTVKDKYGYVKGFSVAGDDKKFYWAKAEIIDERTVAVYSEECPDPVSVRYGWANNPDDVNLYNREGLPANPFRTDNWQGITK